MPQKDGMGSEGKGPRTGRGRGPCDCCSRNRDKSLSKDEERTALEVDVKDLEDELMKAKERLAELKS